MNQRDIDFASNDYLGLTPARDWRDAASGDDAGIEKKGEGDLRDSLQGRAAPGAAKLGSPVRPATVKEVNRIKAVNYAWAWSRGPWRNEKTNPAYRHESNNCANFVSQALHVGGMKMDTASHLHRNNHEW